ncbi:MBL fold metallo-hydrolase [Roseivivax sp. CAU 1761]
MHLPTRLVALIALLAPIFAAPLHAQETRRPSHCIAVAEAPPPARLHRASWSDPLPAHTARIHYIQHASFLIQSPGGVNAVTDFTGFIGTTAMIPDAVTMNHAHSTHWTPVPDPAIPHVLPGWGEVFGEGISHHREVGDMLIRNVSTDIRSAYGGVEPRGNSIFVFEVAGLCIVHLGHLHHEPDAAQYAALGRADVLMVPVDGGFTMAREAMIRVVDRLQATMVIPMHWFSTAALEDFLAGMPERWAINRAEGAAFELSLATLPARPTVLVLSPERLRDPLP